MRYTIPLSPEFLKDVAAGGFARLMMGPDGDKYKASVSVDNADGTTFDVPIRMKVDELGVIYITFEA